MRPLRVWLVRVAGLFTARRRNRDVVDELESHLQMHVDDNMRAGLPAAEARRRAVAILGGVEPVREAQRDRGSVPFVAHLWQDARFAFRQFRRAPGFAAATILVLSLGIGASVSMFAFVDAALIKPLPYHDVHRLLDVTEKTAQIPHANLSYLDYLDWKQRSTAFASLEVHAGTGFMLTAATGAIPLPAARVSSGFFRTLGVMPVIGRDFSVVDGPPKPSDEVLLSYATWQRHFGGRADVVGHTIRLNGAPRTVIGVLPAAFHFAPRVNAELWVPLGTPNGCEVRRSCHNLSGVGRLKDDVSIEAARAEMAEIAAALEMEYPDSNRGQSASVLPLTAVIVGEVRPVLFTLLGGAGLLLLIACVNVTSLLLVRTESRARELAVRGALGASTSRLIRQFVTENTIVVTIATVGGLAIGHWGIPLLVALIPVDMLGQMPYLEGIHVSARMVLYAGIVALAAIALFSAATLGRVTRAGMRQGMEEGGRGSGGLAWRRLGSRLVVTELAVAMVLLVAAGLLGKSVYQLLRVDLNFNPDGVAIFGIAAPGSQYDGDLRNIALADDILGRVARLPGVTAVGTTSVFPVSFNGNTDWIRFVGRPYGGEHNEVNLRVVSAGYFDALQAPMVRGRAFTEADDRSQRNVVIISEALARMYFPGEDALGQQIGDTSLTPGSIKEIVGIVADIREGSLDSDIWPATYLPFRQAPDRSFEVVVRTAGVPGSLLPSIETLVREFDPDLSAIDSSTMTERIHRSPTAYMHRSVAWLATGFAGVAWVLAVVGLYSVLAYLVSQRTREIGVRMALGAQRSSVSRLVVLQAGRLAVVGTAIGLACAIGAASLMRELLFDTPPWDAGTLGLVAGVLVVSSLAAGYIPARRAASVDPIRALRAD